MSSEAKIGLMVISCIIIFVGGLLYLGKLSIVANGYEVHVLFEFVSDLKKESKVKYAGGVVVGKVREIQLEKNKAKVSLWIKKDFKIHKDAEFAIFTSGLMGEKYIEVAGGSENSPYLNNGDTLQGVNPMSTDIAITKLSNILGELKDAMASVNSVIGSPEAKNAILDSLNNIKSATTTANRIVEENEKPIVSAIGNFKESSEKINKITKNVEDLTNEIGKILTKENIKNIEETLANLSKASEKLDKTLVSLDTILKGIEKGEGSLGLLMTDKALAEDLKTLVEDLKSHPWKLLWRR